jgi:hypothetical protein
MKKLFLTYAIFGVAGIIVVLLFHLERKLPWRPWRILFTK